MGFNFLLKSTSTPMGNYSYHSDMICQPLMRDGIIIIIWFLSGVKVNEFMPRVDIELIRATGGWGHFVPNHVRMSSSKLFMCSLMQVPALSCMWCT